MCYLDYNCNSSRFVAACSNPQPIVYDRNGNKIIVFIKGDPYVLDNSKTPGHTNTITATHWHPNIDNNLITSSLDGTCRIWDLNGETSFNELKSIQVIRAKSKKGLREGICSAMYNPTGNQIVIGCNEGGVQLFDARNKFFLFSFVHIDFRVQLFPISPYIPIL